MNQSQNENEYLYKAVMEGKQKSRIWSVSSLLVSIISLLCCCLPWVGVVAGILSIIFAIVSRKSIGYFDGLSIAGLIVGIFGLVFGISGFVLDYLIQNTDILDEFIKEYERQLSELYGSGL